MEEKQGFTGFCMPLRGASATEARRAIKSSSKPVVVKFHSTACPSCVEASSSIQEAACPYRPDVEFLAVDVDQNPELAEQFNIKNIPFVAGFKNGQLLTKKVGADEPAEYGKFIERLIKKKVK
jgi:thioredoxin-like negative regulator of GroEL